MIHKEFKQGSEEWHNYRLGKVTASRIIDIMPGKTGYKKSRDNYLAELACEILTGKRQESFTSEAMQRGIGLEAFARAEFEIRECCMVEEVGFIDYDSIANTGCSPDGLIIGTLKGIEIKCPNTATHLETVFTDKIKTEYIHQIQFTMMCTNSTSWYFVSFDDRLPENIQYYKQEVVADATLQVKIKHELSKFMAELTAMVDKIKHYKGNV